MKKKQLVYWMSLILGVFLLFIGSGSIAKADTASDVDAAINTGVNYTAQKGNSLGAWDAPILAMSPNGITDAQAQTIYNAIISGNKTLGGSGTVSDTAAIVGLRAIGKDPTNVNNKDLIASAVTDANTATDLYNMIYDLESLSTGNYGTAAENAKQRLIDKITTAQDTSGLWIYHYTDFYTKKPASSTVDPTAQALLVLSMNNNDPTAHSAVEKAITAIENDLYQKNGGFMSDSNPSGPETESAVENVTLTNALVIAGVDVYSPLNGQADYTSPIQRLLDQKVTSTPSDTFLLYEGTSALQQAKFTKDGGKGSIFAFDQNAAFKPGELASLNAAADAKKQAINNDSLATTTDKSNAIANVNQILATYTDKINADSTSAAAIADRNAGANEINNVVVAHNATTTTINNGLSVSTTAPSPLTVTPVSSPTVTPTVTQTTVKKSHSAKGTVVYGLTTVRLYKGTNFTKSNLSKTYKKQARINRPMFLVINQTTNKQGRAIYKVKDLKGGKTGYTLSGSKYFANAYYSAKVTKVKVINPKGVNEYRKVQLTNKKRHVKKNASLSVKKVVNFGVTTRFELTNGNYISANKKLVLATKISKASGATGSTTTATTTNTNPTKTNSTTPSSTTVVTPTNSGSTATNSGGTVPNNTPVTPVNPNNATQTVTVTVTANGSVLASGSVTVAAGASGMDALNALAAQKGLAISTSGSGPAVYINGIGSYKAGADGPNSGWVYSVNGNEPNSSIGAYTVKSGDTISLNYVK